jgi:hypothetical protein
MNWPPEVVIDPALLRPHEVTAEAVRVDAAEPG